MLAGFLGQPAVVVAGVVLPPGPPRNAGRSIFSRPMSWSRKALPHDSAIRSCSRVSSARASGIIGGPGLRIAFIRRKSPARASSSARAIRPQASRVASHSSTRRTWQTSRTSWTEIRRTTAPRLGTRSMMPIPASAISASRTGVWLTWNRSARSCVTRWSPARMRRRTRREDRLDQGRWRWPRADSASGKAHGQAKVSRRGRRRDSIYPLFDSIEDRPANNSKPIVTSFFYIRRPTMTRHHPGPAEYRQRLILFSPSDHARPRSPAADRILLQPLESRDTPNGPVPGRRRAYALTGDDLITRFKSNRPPGFHVSRQHDHPGGTTLPASPRRGQPG